MTKNVINLENDYYIETIEPEDELPANSINLEKLKLADILNKKVITFYINFKRINTREYKKWYINFIKLSLKLHFKNDKSFYNFNF